MMNDDRRLAAIHTAAAVPHEHCLAQTAEALERPPPLVIAPQTAAMRVQRRIPARAKHRPL